MGSKLILFLVALAACNNDLCARHSDCAHGQVCSAAGVCVGAPDAGTEPPPADASTTDAASIDGGP
jgi:hypothetical protein